MHEACRTCAPCPVICKIDPWCTSCTQNQARWFLWTRAFVISTPARAPPARASVMLFRPRLRPPNLWPANPSGCVGLTRSRASMRPLPSLRPYQPPHQRSGGFFMPGFGRGCASTVSGCPKEAPMTCSACSSPAPEPRPSRKEAVQQLAIRSLAFLFRHCTRIALNEVVQELIRIKFGS